MGLVAVEYFGNAADAAAFGEMLDKRRRRYSAASLRLFLLKSLTRRCASINAPISHGHTVP